MNGKGNKEQPADFNLFLFCSHGEILQKSISMNQVQEEKDEKPHST